MLSNWPLKLQLCSSKDILLLSEHSRTLGIALVILLRYSSRPLHTENPNCNQNCDYTFIHSGFVFRYFSAKLISAAKLMLAAKLIFATFSLPGTIIIFLVAVPIRTLVRTASSGCSGGFISRSPSKSSKASDK